MKVISFFFHLQALLILLKWSSRVLMAMVEITLESLGEKKINCFQKSLPFWFWWTAEAEP